MHDINIVFHTRELASTPHYRTPSHKYWACLIFTIHTLGGPWLHWEQIGGVKIIDTPHHTTVHTKIIVYDVMGLLWSSREANKPQNSPDNPIAWARHYTLSLKNQFQLRNQFRARWNISMFGFSWVQDLDSRAILSDTFLSSVWKLCTCVYLHLTLLTDISVWFWSFWRRYTGFLLLLLCLIPVR